MVERELNGAPALIPPYAHRGIPNDPLVPGNPAFSVWQTDVIVYGGDLEEYLRNEFQREWGAAPIREVVPRTVRFWTAMLDADEFEGTQQS